MKKSQTLLDYLSGPEFKELKQYLSSSLSDQRFASKLITLWETDTDSINELKNVHGFTLDELNTLEKSGLISQNLNKVVITHKGKNLIKKVILDNDVSAFEKANVKTASTKSNNWFNKNICDK